MVVTSSRGRLWCAKTAYGLRIRSASFRSLWPSKEELRCLSVSADMPYPKFLILVLEHLSLECSAPSFIIGNLVQRFAFLLTFPDGLSWVAERKDREDRDLLGNAQQAVDLRQVVEANPV